MSTASVISFAHDCSLRTMPEEVAAFGRRCLLDLLGVAAAGSQTETARLIGDHAEAYFGAGGSSPSARMLFDGRPVSPAGAALAGGMTIDSVDAHDGKLWESLNTTAPAAKSCGWWITRPC